MYPWAVTLRELRWVAFVPMGFFLFVLIFGFLYEWRKGALRWED
jgi:NADH-quinone oxidoreductase subunit A